MPEKSIDKVWEFRKKYEKYWATPDLLWSLRFAFTEIAEAMDAWIRVNSNEFSRNREKDMQVIDELADTAIMLLTALGPKSWVVDRPVIHKTSIETIAERIGHCMKKANDGAELPHLEATIIMAYTEILSLGVTPEDIQRRLDRIFEKHVSSKVSNEL